MAGKSAANANWQESWASEVVNLGLAAIYSISVQPDANDTLVNRVYVSLKIISYIFHHLLHLFVQFDASTFGLGRNQLVNRSAYPDIVNAYKKYILQSAVLLGAKNDSETQKQIDELLDFESQLANVLKIS